MVMQRSVSGGPTNPHYHLQNVALAERADVCPHFAVQFLESLNVTLDGHEELKQRAALPPSSSYRHHLAFSIKKRVRSDLGKVVGRAYLIRWSSAPIVAQLQDTITSTTTRMPEQIGRSSMHSCA